MKKLLFLLVVFAFLVSTPITLLAQGFSPFALPGGFLGFGPRPAPSGYDGVPVLDPLTFYVGWMEPGADTRFSFDGTAIGGISGLAHRWSTRGLWLLG
ncbi:MAG TPA: hypothetical protein VMC85_18140 [Desulfomonilaceae bacterium]|nr:hypothetical protein [Desulfomonilaceae bacterium]